MEISHVYYSSGEHKEIQQDSGDLETIKIKINRNVFCINLCTHEDYFTISVDAKYKAFSMFPLGLNRLIINSEK